MLFVPHDLIEVYKRMPPCLKKFLHDFGIAVYAVVGADAGGREVQGVEGYIFPCGEGGAESAAETSETFAVADGYVGDGGDEFIEGEHGSLIEPPSGAEPFVMILIEWDEGCHVHSCQESLHGDDDLVGFGNSVYEINDRVPSGDVFDTDEGDFIGGYIIEPLYQIIHDHEIRVEGDDCWIGMIIDGEEVWGFDIGVDEEEVVGVLHLELIELGVLFRGAVEIIGDGYTDDTRSIHITDLLYIL